MEHSEFFACCADGVWKVSSHKTDGRPPLVEKIALRSGAKPSHPTELKGGNCIAITHEGIFLYFQPERYECNDPIILRLPEDTDKCNIGSSTGKLLHCYLDEEEALQDNLELDASVDSNIDFHEESLEVFALIGENHPLLVIARDNNINHRFAFPMELYERIGMNRYSHPTFSRESATEVLGLIKPWITKPRKLKNDQAPPIENIVTSVFQVEETTPPEEIPSVVFGPEEPTEIKMMEPITSETAT